MAIARLGGGNNFAIYWLDLVTLGTIRLWWKFRLITLDPMLPKKTSSYMVVVLSCRFSNRV